MKKEFKIRLALEKDAEVLRELCESTFVDTYSTFNTPENLQKHITQNFSLQRITSDIKNADNQWFTLIFDKKNAGYAKLIKNHIPAEITEKQVVEIEKFYIKKDFHGKDLGRLLMNFCEDWAKKNTFEVIWLGVWENNQNAINFYKKMGFEIFGSHTFFLGNEAQNDFLMKKYIR